MAMNMFMWAMTKRTMQNIEYKLRAHITMEMAHVVSAFEIVVELMKMQFALISHFEINVLPQ